MQDLTLDLERPDPALAPAALALSGQLPRPATLGLGELLAFPRRELGRTQVNCFTGRAVATVDRMAGARLIDVLDAAGFSTQPRATLKRCVVLAVGGDDYRALFSWNELYNAGIGDGVLVLYERDGRPLPPGLGPLSLISANDRQLGPRHLRCLRGIQVRML